MTTDITSESGSTGVQSEFVVQEFETTVTDEDRNEIIETIVDAISNLREQTAFVLDDFHRMQNPRVMNEAYYEELA